MLLFFILTIQFAIAHFLFDYVWQTKYHLRKFNRTGWVMPLISHSADHAFSQFAIIVVTMAFVGITFNIILVAFTACLLSGVVHFVTDRIKAHPDIFPKYSYPSKSYFVAHGLDQLVHQLTYISLAFVIAQLG